MKTWAEALLDWQSQHGRHDLPWQGSEPYRVWLSEIMLQQTQVATVLDYFPRFIARFPTLETLAAADLDAVLQLWAGLGYYRRARFLHQAAQEMMRSGIPQTRAGWEALPGIGRSTAAAISAFCYQQREAILDGNVKRVLCRAFARDGDLQNKRFEAELWALAEALLPHEQAMPRYTQAMMDLGALICSPKQPLCHQCPVQNQCLAYRTGRVHALPRPKKALPVTAQDCFWLLIFDAQGRLLLQKRRHGIWQNLYSVPSFDTEAARDAFIKQHDLSASWRELETFSHRLTHRLLKIKPLIYEDLNPVACADYVYGVPSQYALPKALSALLAQLA